MIREANQTDAERIGEIYNHYVINSIATFEVQPLSTETMAARMKSIQQLSLPWLVLLDQQDRLQGYAYASQWSPRTAYDRTVEITVYIAPSATSQQYGSKLYEALLSELKTSGAHVAVGGISLPNAASVALHEKFGMTKVAHFSEVGYKFGKWIDVGYWQAMLT